MTGESPAASAARLHTMIGCNGNDTREDEASMGMGAEEKKGRILIDSARMVTRDVDGSD
jgi:hypothetical protein